MTLAECATLAGLVKSPNKLSPWTDREASKEARNFVLNRMRELGFINARTIQWRGGRGLANRQPAKRSRTKLRDRLYPPTGNRHRRLGPRDERWIPDSHDDRLRLQEVAEKSLRAQLDAAEETPGYGHQTYAQYSALLRELHKNKSPNDKASVPRPDYLQGAVIALDNRTGGMLALVGGRDFEQNEYNRALQARRPPGTAILPFVYAAAFSKGPLPGFAGGGFRAR